MNVDEFCEILIELFPEKKDNLIQHKNDYGKILGHVFLGDEISEILFDLLSNRNGNEELIKKYINCLEMIYKKGNADLLNVLDVTILERLSDDSNVWTNLSNYISNELKDYINNELLNENILMKHVKRMD